MNAPHDPFGVPKLAKVIPLIVSPLGHVSVTVPPSVAVLQITWGTTQAPFKQVLVVPEQVLPHAPQLFGSVALFTSHPSETTPSQSA